jgi:hypothetical protein
VPIAFAAAKVNDYCTPLKVTLICVEETPRMLKLFGSPKSYRICYELGTTVMNFTQNSREI